MSEPQILSPNQPHVGQKLLRAGMAVGLALGASGDTPLSANISEQAKAAPTPVVAEFTPVQPDNGITITDPNESSTRTTIPPAPETTTTAPAETTTTASAIEPEQPAEETTSEITPPDLPTPILPPHDIPTTDPDKPVPDDGTETTIPAPPEQEPHYPKLEFQTVPERVSEKLRTEAVYLDGNGCSAFLIRNPAGEAVGVETADHCLSASRYPRIEGNDGQTYIVNSSKARVGDRVDQLTEVGSLDKFIVPDEITTWSQDLAYGVFQGRTETDVLANYKHLAEDEVRALPRGSVVYMRGYPVDQPGNDVMQAQEFALTVIGTTTINVSNGKTLEVLLTAIPKNAANIVCSYGSSGSQGSVEREVTEPNGTIQYELHSAGSLAVFNNFEGSTFNKTEEEREKARKWYEDEYQLDLSNAGGVCGFSFGEIDPSTNAIVLKTVESLDKVPGQVDHEKEYQEFRQRIHDTFFDPATTRTIIDGWVEMPLMRGGPGSPSSIWADRPDIIYDEKSGGSALVWFSPKGEDSLNIVRIPLENVTVWDKDIKPGVDLLTSTGNVQQSVDAQGNLLNSFTDAGGLVFGEPIEKAPVLNSPYEIIKDDKNQFLVKPARK